MVREGNSLFHPYNALVADFNELLNSTCPAKLLVLGEGKGSVDIMAKLGASGSNINELVVSPPKVFAYLRVLQALHGDAVVFVS